MKNTNEVERNINVAIRSCANVLITGQTGTGKTRLARRIHDESPRRSRAFVPINLAALHEGTIESELFGHEKGAFTGADRKRKGLLEIADGGTVLLDEIGELPPRLQARFLEFLQSRTITPVGGSVPVKLDVRVIAATHRNLNLAVSRGDFREDLFHRLRVVLINLEPIAIRWRELDQIVHDCLEEVCRSTGRTVLRISEEVARQLESHSWPGNYRELRNVLEYAVHAGHDHEIQAGDLPSWFSPLGAATQPICASEATGGTNRGEQEQASLQVAKPLDFRRSVAEFEKGFIVQHLKSCGGNVSRTARQIGMDKATLLRRIRLHGLKRGPAEIPWKCMTRN